MPPAQVQGVLAMRRIPTFEAAAVLSSFAVLQNLPLAIDEAISTLMCLAMVRHRLAGVAGSLSMRMAWLFTTHRTLQLFLT